MKNFSATILFLAATVHAGNLCVAGTYKPSKIDLGHVLLFAAGHSCEDDNRMKIGTQVSKLCDDLPQGINVCGQNANLIKIDHGPTSAAGCQIGLEVNGDVHEGVTYAYNPDDGNAHDGPCDASCGLTEGIDGFLEFSGVPMCDL